MSHFYGSIQGARGGATRTGTKNSGLITHAAGWGGAIRTTVFQDEQGRDCFKVEEVPWQGAGVSEVLTTGVLGIKN